MPLQPSEVGGRSRPSCGRCGFIHFGSWTVGVGGLVVVDDQVLLARRAIAPAKGTWAIPGGYVESDETLAEAVVRELHEETGVKTEVLATVSVRSVVLAARLDTYVVFTLRLIEGEATPDGTENDEVGWFSLSGLHEAEGLTLDPPFVTVSD